MGCLAPAARRGVAPAMQCNPAADFSTQIAYAGVRIEGGHAKPLGIEETPSMQQHEKYAPGEIAKGGRNVTQAIQSIKGHVGEACMAVCPGELEGEVPTTPITLRTRMEV